MCVVMCGVRVEPKYIFFSRVWRECGFDVATCPWKEDGTEVIVYRGRMESM